MAMRRLNWLAGLLVPAAILLSGCDPLDTAGGGTTNEAGVDSATGSAGCGQPGPQAGGLLPDFDTSDEREATVQPLENPCPPFTELISVVNAVIPDADKASRGVSDFIDGVRSLADHFLTAVDLVECGYETDGLAVGIYQHADYPWSVGVVVVVRPTVGAAVKVAECYLEKQFSYETPGGQPTGAERPGPGPEFCPLSGSGDGGYVVVALGSSNWMCDALRGGPAGLS